jgi:hypothetical protein
MRIRRPLAGLFIALTLFGGGGATLAGCGDPVDSDTGTSKDTAGNTAGATSPGSSPAGQVPDLSNREPSSTATKGGVGGGNQNGGG